MTSVWIVNHYAGDPAETASGSRHYSLARELATRGWDPVIVAASVEHNTSRQRLPKGQRIGTTRRSGVTFRWLRTSTYGGNGIGRVVNVLQFTSALLGSRWRKDLVAPAIVIGSTVHPFAALAASRLARKYEVPFIFEIRDLWPQTLIDMRKIAPGGPVARTLRRIERHLCARASKIITLLPEAHLYLEAQGVPPEKIVWLSNGTDSADFTPAPEPGEDEPFSFVYLGSLGHANGVHTILHGFARVENTSSVLKIVGSGPERDSLRRLSNELGIEHRVLFANAVPKAEVPSIASSAHCLVVNVLDLPIYKYGISLNKLFDYMASGRPIVIASNAANNPVLDADAGVSVPADDPGALAAAMNQVCGVTAAQRRAWGRNGRAHVSEKYDYSVLGSRLNEILRECLSEEASAIAESSRAARDAKSRNGASKA